MIKFSYPPLFSHANEPALWQNPWEWDRLLNLFSEFKVKRYLEVGTGWGEMIRYLRETSEIKAYGIDKDPLTRSDNFPETWLHIGDSRSTGSIDFAKAINPDAILIDGDHSYHVVKEDFNLYYPLATKLIILHDIAANKSEPYPTDDGVKNLWNEIKHHYRTIEIISREPFGYGIGVIVKESVWT